MIVTAVAKAFLFFSFFSFLFLFFFFFVVPPFLILSQCSLTVGFDLIDLISSQYPLLNGWYLLSFLFFCSLVIPY